MQLGQSRFFIISVLKPLTILVRCFYEICLRPHNSSLEVEGAMKQKFVSCMLLYTL